MKDTTNGKLKSSTQAGSTAVSNGQDTGFSVGFLPHGVWQISQRGELTAVPDPFPYNDGDFAGLMDELGYWRQEFGSMQEVILYERNDTEDAGRPWLYILEVTPMNGRVFLILAADFPALLAATQKVEPLLAMGNAGLLDEIAQSGGAR